MLFKSLCISLFQWFYSWIKKIRKPTFKSRMVIFAEKSRWFHVQLFFAISFGSVYVEKLSSVVLFWVISVGPLSKLEWLGFTWKFLIFFHFPFYLSQWLAIELLATHLIQSFWFPLVVLHYTIFRLTFKSFVFIRNISMAYGVLDVQCARYKCQCQCQCRCASHIDAIQPSDR